CLFSSWRMLSLKECDLRIDKSHLKYALLLMPNTMLWWVVNASDKYFLQFMVGASAVGIYAVAAKFPTLITSFYRIVAQIWQITLVRNEGKDISKVWFFKYWLLVWTFYVSLPVSMYL